jgi:hypothetical protein
MLPQLTTYLLQFHQVHIPSVGTVRLVQQPASLDIANKIIQPPQFNIQFNEDGWLGKHQLWFFSEQLHVDENATRQALEDAGIDIRKVIEQQPFVWNSIGTFTYKNHAFHFEPAAQPQILPPVNAERVLREGVQHSVLVGDQVVVSDGHAAAEAEEERPWNWSRIIGWAAIVLSLFFILYYLYQHQFSPTATSLRKNVSAAPAPATYRQ